MCCVEGGDVCCVEGGDVCCVEGLLCVEEGLWSGHAASTFTYYLFIFLH